jgi:outer membrane protein TolC
MQLPLRSAIAAVLLHASVAAFAQQSQTLQLDAAVKEALAQNPEIQTAKSEYEAAEQRIAPAGALEDPMLEMGVINLPVPSYSFHSEDMTMKMIQLSQRFPYPGKRGLRKDVATREADALQDTYRETVNRVMRDVKLAYFDLSLVIETVRLTEKNRRVLQQLAQIVESRYVVGQASQADVLKAQTQVSKMTEELLKLDRDRQMIEADLNRALGRGASSLSLAAQMPQLRDAQLRFDTLRDAALQNRPLLLAQQNVIAKSGNALELAGKDANPDFDVRLWFGQRDSTPTGERRDNMIGVTVAVNLPIWKESRITPRINEAAAMREQALSMYRTQLNEVTSRLRQNIANAEQSLRSAHLYADSILPQARLTIESAFAAYKVNRVDVLTLLDDQMTVFNYEVSYATAVVSQNKALAEIEFAIGMDLI